MTLTGWLVGAVMLTAGTIAGYRLRGARDREGRRIEALIDATREREGGPP